MCKSKRRSDGIEPGSTRATSLKPTASSPSSSSARPSGSFAMAQNALIWTSSQSASPNSSSLSTTTTSLASLRFSLSQNPIIFSFSEICSATANFTAGKLSSAAWRCSFRGSDAIVLQRKFRRLIEPHDFRARLSLIGRVHHKNLVELIGASRSDDHVYLVYEHVQGCNLATCLRNPKNPSFTTLSTWISRMQIATDVAHGLDYIHNCDGSDSKLVHNRIKSSSIIVVEPSFKAKICHFATAELCGEASDDQMHGKARERVEDALASPKPRRPESRGRAFEGTRGYMSPEFKSSGAGSQKSDVFAFGVVMLELLSGEEPLKYEFDRSRECYRRMSVIERAREVMGEEDEQGMKVRSWIDRRLKDSFPVKVARKMTQVALDCVDAEPERRPTMSRVALKISRLFLESEAWSQSMASPSGLTTSFAPR